MDFQPISRTKITPPIVRRETLTRDRLIEWLHRHTRRRLTLVIADAGYGKTTLLADYGRHSQASCLWYKLDPSDADWVTLANYLVAAIREIRPEFGAATMSLLRQMATADTPRQLVIDTLLAEVAELEERAVLIFDDFHLVESSRDVAEIVGRLLREAPPGFSFVLASRRRPELALARAAAQGEVGQLLTDDLRFSHGETDELFSETYEQPLEPEVLDQLERKTEGWAASLQLFHSSIRGRSSLEIRAFARSLSGTQGPIYDFLAEEVLRELTPPLRRFLVGSAILERIVPPLVVAAFAADAEPPTDNVARGWIEAADDLGLMGRRGESGRGYRFHPLLRDFLLRQLERDASAETIRAMHGRVARAAEREDWLTACHHYLEAGEPTHAIRVMGDSLLVAIGTGAWGMAAALLDRLGDEPDEPAVQVILALREIQQGDVAAAETRLHAIDLDRAPAQMRSLIRHALLRATFNRGDLEASRAIVDAILSDPDGPPLIGEIARTFRVLHLQPRSHLANASKVVQALASHCQLIGLPYFTAISLHNAMELELAAGRYRDAYDLGERALEQLATTLVPAAAASTHATLAICAAELRRFDLMGEHLSVALDGAGGPDADCAVTSAYLFCNLGKVEKAWNLLASASGRVLGQPIDAAVTTWLRLAEARLAVSRGDTRDVVSTLEFLDPYSPAGPGTDAACRMITSLAWLQRGEITLADEAASEGLRIAISTGAGSWDVRLQVVKAAIERDGQHLRATIARAAQSSGLALLDTAEAIAHALDVLQPVPPEILESMAEWPERWRQVLRRQLELAPGPGSMTAATLLESIGTIEDVPRLRAFERTYVRSRRGPKLGRLLAVRESPRLEVRDLGGTSFDVGPRRVAVGSMRRRAASLLVYLIARPKQSAPREKVLDDLWPDLNPAAGANSLNQTLYFLRRDIDPWYEDGVAVDYVSFEGEILALVPALVEIESVEFQRRALHVLSLPEVDPEELLESLSRYRGRFAPEFDYEDWSVDWREFLHTTYLHLVSAAQQALVGAREVSRAIAVTQTALTLDPRNPELNESLVQLYAAAGSKAAAAEQYARYSEVHREELGVSPPPLSELAGAPFQGRDRDRIRHKTY